MNIKVLALDLDGTLTNSEKKITLKTKETLQRAIKNGVHVVLASGRPTVGIRPVAKELELEKLGGYILAFNGGSIIDCATNREISSEVLPMEYFSDLCKIAKQHHLAILTYQGDHILSESDTDPYVLRECFINRTKITKVEDLQKTITKPVPKCLIVGDHEQLLPVKQQLEKEYQGIFSVYFSEPFFLEIMPLGVEKSSSLAKLLSLLSLDEQNLMACGDGYNDVTMIDYAGLGVAMDNACHEVKKVSDYITSSNDEDGVAVAVEKFILDA